LKYRKEEKGWIDEIKPAKNWRQAGAIEPSDASVFKKIGVLEPPEAHRRLIF
jgi:hypothetical protein